LERESLVRLNIQMVLFVEVELPDVGKTDERSGPGIRGTNGEIIPR
jgi:hypothetical protein